MSASTSSRTQLNDYFAAELAGLRTRAIEFASENPSIAEELMLNKDNEGKSRDPHVEILIQSFAWLTSRLRQNIETESSKLPALMLQQLYPQLVSSIPSMAIAEFKVKASANFDQGYILNGHQVMEPLNITSKGNQADRLKQCKFTSSYDTVLWPFQTNEVSIQSLNDMSFVSRYFSNVQSAVDIRLKEVESDAGTDTCFSRPLRFYINLGENLRFKFYDILCKHFVGAVVVDSKNSDTPLAVLSKQDMKLCGFEDHERMFPLNSHQDLGFSLLQDYFCFPEKFMFFELSGMENISGKSNFHIKLLFDENLPESVKLNKDAFKLNCAPVINLFQKTTEPLPLHYKDYRYRLYPSREYYDAFEIVGVNKVYSVNKQGETRELSPYFSLQSQDRDPGGTRWMVLHETSHRKQLSGTESWLSLFDVNYENTCPVGDTLFAETWCSNRSACELFNKSQKFGLVGSSPVNEVHLLTRPTRHKGSQMNKEHLWQMLSHLSVYYVSLSDEKTAKDTLTRFLSLYVSKNNPVSQRQIESIEKLEAQEDVQPHISESWRGYYRGTRFTLTLTERKFDGSSPLLFGQVLHQFLALFCHINSFVRLELKLGNRSVYQWQPMSGHQILV